MKQCKIPIDLANPKFEHAQKIWRLIDKGLTSGLGRPVPGEMCVEALVSYVMGEEHGDQPRCVMSAVNGDKIAINDKCKWSSNRARGKGMKRFAIAQLGTKGMNEKLYRKLFTEEVKRFFLPLAWKANAVTFLQKQGSKQVLALLKTPKGVKKFIKVFEEEFEIDLSTGLMDAADAIYVIVDTLELNDKTLTQLCECGVRALTKMKSPGSKWLKKLQKA